MIHSARPEAKKGSKVAPEHKTGRGEAVLIRAAAASKLS